MLNVRESIEREQLEVVCIDNLVPKNHLVRKLEKAINLRFIYDLVKDMYSYTGAPSVDPVVLFKLNIIQYTFGIRSMRQTLKECEVNAAYRWYLGYTLNEKLPHFSVYSANYKRKFEGTEVFSEIFKRIIVEINRHGFIDDSNVFIDGTHIKANANNHKYKVERTLKSAKYYEEELQKEINADRERHGKKPLQPCEEEPEMKDKKVSTTDPDCGIFHKGEHKKVFAYVANVACDKHNFILDFELDAGNKNDSVLFPRLYNKLKEEHPNMTHVVMDAGYKTPAIAKQIIDDERIPVLPYKRPMTKDGFFKKYEYVYDEHYDCYICPNNKILTYSTSNREGYKEYKSQPKDCASCQLVQQCTESKNKQKVVTRHVWESYMEIVEEIRHSDGMKEMYKKRSETIERVFADAKELHGMRYAKHRGKENVKSELYLLFACMNLKKMANWLAS